MKEDEVYRATKVWFVERGFEILAGQPPRGTDRFPVVEIKASDTQERGSAGSYKPDLIVANSEVILVIECKPSYSRSDVEKLIEIKSDQRRQDALLDELGQRRLLERRGLSDSYPTIEVLRTALRYAVSYAGPVVAEGEVYSLVHSDEPLRDARLYLDAELVHSVA